MLIRKGKFILFLFFLLLLPSLFFVILKYAMHAEAFDHVIPQPHIGYVTPSLSLHYTMKVTITANKTTAVADGSDRIYLQIGQFFASECTADPNILPCDSCWSGASSDNLKPACRKGENSDQCSSSEAVNFQPLLVSSNTDTTNALAQAWSLNFISSHSVSGDNVSTSSAFSCQNGLTTFSLKSTTPGTRKLVIAERYQENWVYPVIHYPKYIMEVEFTAPTVSPTPPSDPLPPTPPFVPDNSNPPTPSPSPTSGTTPSSTTTASSGSTPTGSSPSSQTAISNPVSTGKTKAITVVNAKGQSTTVSQDYSIEIASVNEKELKNLEESPLNDDDKITIRGKTNLLETKFVFEINSEPQIIETFSDKDGAWTINIPKKLPTGEHTVYFTAYTKDGQLLVEKTELSKIRVVEKREFTVQSDSLPTKASKVGNFYEKHKQVIVITFGIISIALIILAVAKVRKKYFIA